MSPARRGERLVQSVTDLITSRFEHFLAVLVVSASIIVIIVALVASVIDTSLSQAVVQGMTAIVSGVIGFYFGNRGAERAEERVREVENQLATGGGPLAIQRGRMDKELQQIHEKMKKAIEQANRASQLHVENQKRDAERYFRNADESIDDCYNAMKAWIYGNHGYLKLDQEEPLPPYDEILKLFRAAKEYREKTDFPDDLFPKRVYLGKAVAEAWLDYHCDAIVSLNMVGGDIKNMDDLFEFEAEDIKPRDVSKFLEVEDKFLKYKPDKCKSVEGLNGDVKDYLQDYLKKYQEKVKSEKERKEQA